jgi:hypothetical protein
MIRGRVDLPSLAFLLAACSPTEHNFTGGAGGTSATTSSTTAAGGSGGTASTSSSSTSATGACLDPQNDPHNCGTCGHDCTTLPGVADAYCKSGACVITSCLPRYGHCSANPDDGCETDFNDPAHCGGCSTTCTLQQCLNTACTDAPPDCTASGCADTTCVESGRWGVADGVAVDLQNGRRLWARDFKASLAFTDATKYCANLILGGVAGWRVPTGGELGSILYRAGGLNGCPTPQYCAPALDQAAFPATPADEFWTVDLYQAGIHYCTSFCDGRKTPYKEDDASLHYVRCVHDPV